MKFGWMGNGWWDGWIVGLFHLSSNRPKTFGEGDAARLARALDSKADLAFHHVLVCLGGDIINSSNIWLNPKHTAKRRQSNPYDPRPLRLRGKVVELRRALALLYQTHR